MEDVAEEAVVNEFFVGVIRFLEITDITVEEAQLATQVVANSRRADAAVLFGESLAQDVDDGWTFVDRLWFVE